MAVLDGIERTHCRVTRYNLPEQAHKMASDVGDGFGMPAVIAPLKQFLRDISRIERIPGLTIAHRSDGSHMVASVYLFADVQAALNGEEAAQAAMDHADLAHARFRVSVQSLQLGVATDLWYVPSTRNDVPDAAHSFVSKLRDGTGNAIHGFALPVNEEPIQQTWYAKVARLP